METKEIERLVACAELRRPKVFNASRERYVIEISFRAGQESGRKEVVKLALQAIEDEPEFPGDIDDELWDALNGNKENVISAMRSSVRLTKKGIVERLEVKLKEWGIKWRLKN